MVVLGGWGSLMSEVPLYTASRVEVRWLRRVFPL